MYACRSVVIVAHKFTIFFTSTFLNHLNLPQIIIVISSLQTKKDIKQSVSFMPQCQNKFKFGEKYKSLCFVCMNLKKNYPNE